ncbi:MAG: bifunctional oligoribonuclease/PAP phosphatase NrnA [Candidatus Omnitrophica bacterium]|nr:bifunctional oligoribonuclease/PAP phosphatase NrnA [Candidatus Omnitrophota bacterium]
MNAKQISKAIKEFNSFLISAHINPEGDAVGSQLAMASLLRRLGKKVTILNESPVPHNLRFMKGAEEILKEAPADLNFEAAVILDCPDVGRLGNVARHVTGDKAIFNIDHHISNVNFGKYNFVDADSSSTGEMVFELFEALDIDIMYDEAVAMYVAIMTDTGSFRYTNTSSRTHMIMAKLLDKGVGPYEIYGHIYENASLQDTNLLAEALGTIKVTDDGKVSWLWVTKEMLKKTKASLEGTEGIINFARAIEDTEIAILFRETGTEGRIKVSFRSKGKVDVNKLAGFFDGGGHATASGCTIFGTIEDVEKKVITKARRILNQGTSSKGTPC